MRNVSKIAGLIAGYAGYRFIAGAFNCIIKDCDILAKVGTGFTGFGFGALIMSITVPAVDEFLDTVTEKKEHVCCGKCQEHADDVEEDLDETAQEKENEDE